METSNLGKTLAELNIDGSVYAFRDNMTLERHLLSSKGVQVRPIGHSRRGQPLWGVQVGVGTRRVSVIAGCHSDEPVGPMTAQAFPDLLAAHFPELLERFTFYIVPQMNPDGADLNRVWFANPPDFCEYVRHAFREPPGDDIEFGFGESSRIRPECAAAMEWLGANGPYAAHFSLHGMAFAEGAWFLLCREWRLRSDRLMDALNEVCLRLKVPMYDVERHGEKGFTRIRPGFCTTPRSNAMQEYFMERDDPLTAGKFLPTSMEFAASLGGEPLCMVSEPPLFLVKRQSSSLTDTESGRLRDELKRLREEGGAVPAAMLLGVAERYGVQPFPIAKQVLLQLAMVQLALDAICPASG
jgi:hypothetical protein